MSETRYGISTSLLGQRVIASTIANDSNANRTIHYLSNTRIFASMYGPSPIKGFTVLTAYTDVSFGGDAADRRSQFGWIVQFNECIINWLSKHQPSVSLSPFEAE